MKSFILELVEVEGDGKEHIYYCGTINEVSQERAQKIVDRMRIRLRAESD